MSKINDQLIIMANRIMDAVYGASLRLKLDVSVFYEMVDSIERVALTDIFNKYGTRPYKKREFLNPVISEDNPDEDFKEYINRVSLSLSDILSTLEFHRANVSKVKSTNKTYTKFFEVYKRNLNSITSVVLTQQDVLLDLLQTTDENELQEKLEAYLGTV